MRGLFLASMFVLGCTGGATVVLGLCSDAPAAGAPAATRTVGDARIVRVTSYAARASAVPVAAGGHRYIRLDLCKAGPECPPITASL